MANVKMAGKIRTAFSSLEFPVCSACQIDFRLPAHHGDQCVDPGVYRRLCRLALTEALLVYLISRQLYKMAFDISREIGKFMLQGWVLTDVICEGRGCGAPKLRTPAGLEPQRLLCASCDAGELHEKTSPSQPASKALSSSGGTSSRRASASTAPTDAGSLDLPLEAFVETPEMQRRRDQADQASTEIGNRLLRGWAMLADVCPNADCVGIPLVRPPKAGGKDPRKECVSCGNVYVSEKDAEGLSSLSVHHPGHESEAGDAPAESLKVLSKPVQVQPRLDVQASALPHATGSVASSLSTGARQADPDPRAAIVSCASSLEATLHVLSNRLHALTTPDPLSDTRSIAETAEAMAKVLDALKRARDLMYL